MNFILSGTLLTFYIIDNILCVYQSLTRIFSSGPGPCRHVWASLTGSPGVCKKNLISEIVRSDCHHTLISFLRTGCALRDLAFLTKTRTTSTHKARTCLHEYRVLLITYTFPRYLPFVQGIHRSPVNSPHKGQWRGALMCSLICAWINGWVNNREAGDLRRHCTYNDVIVMLNVTKFILKMRYFSVRLYPELVHQDPFCDYGGMMKKRSILFKSFMNIFE